MQMAIASARVANLRASGVKLNIMCYYDTLKTLVTLGGTPRSPWESCTASLHSDGTVPPSESGRDEFF
jgi:hypothetical protein